MIQRFIDIAYTTSSLLGAYLRSTNNPELRLLGYIAFLTSSFTVYHLSTTSKGITMRHTKPALTSMERSPEQIQRDNDLAQKWHTTATQPWHEYMKTVHSNGAAWHAMQSAQDDAENEASKNRVKDYITKYGHMFK